MQSKIGKIVMGLIAVALAVAFLLPPIIKLKDPALIIVVMIGVAAMIYSVVEGVREKDDS